MNHNTDNVRIVSSAPMVSPNALIEKLPLSEIKLQLEANGILTLVIDDSEISISQDAIKLIEEYQTDKGKEVNVLTVPHATILLHL